MISWTIWSHSWYRLLLDLKQWNLSEWTLSYLKCVSKQKKLLFLKKNNLDKCKFGLKLTFFLRNTYFAGYQKGHDMWRQRSTSKCPSGDFLRFYFVKSSFYKRSSNFTSRKKWPSKTQEAVSQFRLKTPATKSAEKEKKSVRRVSLQPLYQQAPYIGLNVIKF